MLCRNFGFRYRKARMRCLVIEDEADTARYICNGLKEEGFSVVWCRDGAEGLNFAVNERWELVILDRMLPGGTDGLSIIQTLRQLRKTTPVLILSALANLDERVRGLRSGGDDYLTKPFAFSELLARGKIAGQVRLPANPRLEWVGEFSELQDAMERLKVVVPITLLLIVLLLFANFSSQVQKPLTLVVVGGILLAPVLILIILPVLIDLFSRRGRRVEATPAAELQPAEQ